MCSIVGNEPRSYKPASDNYFKQVATHTRELDPSRPVTLVVNAPVDKVLTAYCCENITTT